MSRSFRLGIFVVFTLTLFAVGVFLIGSRQYMFSSTYKLGARFKTVSGLSVGAEVRVGGIHRGAVRQIALPANPDGQMEVQMVLDKSTRTVLRQDSVASIQTEGLLGNKYVEISFGTPEASAIADGGVVRTQPPLDISDLMEKTRDILDSTKLLTENIEQISSKINRGDGSIGALVNDKRLYTELHQATTQAKLGATAFDENMEALRHNFFLRGFFNQRGYSDLARFSQNEIHELPQGTVARQFELEPKKMFDEVDSAKLRNEKALDDAGRFLEANPFQTAAVVVGGGMKGDAREVLELTQARAMVIRDYLVNHFKMDDSKLKTLGLGKSKSGSPMDASVQILVYSASATK